MLKLSNKASFEYLHNKYGFVIDKSRNNEYIAVLDKDNNHIISFTNDNDRFLWYMARTLTENSGKALNILYDLIKQNLVIKE